MKLIIYLVRPILILSPPFTCETLDNLNFSQSQITLQQELQLYKIATTIYNVLQISIIWP